MLFMLFRIVIFLIGGNLAVLGSVVNKNNFLDIIIDDTHAYTYLSSKSSKNGDSYSIYSSLMPKDEEVHEGVEDFPKILQLLFEAGDFVAESATGISLYAKDKLGNTRDSQSGFTFRDLVDACRFGFCYMIADYVKTAVEGKIVTDPPDPQDIKLRKRFYLTPQQARTAIALFNRLSRESLEGKIVYDKLNHNCVDYVKEIYEGIGLDESQGEFLSQFGLDTSFAMLDEGEDFDPENPAYMILKAYKIHNEGAIGFQKVLSIIWNATKSCLGV